MSKIFVGSPSLWWHGHIELNRDTSHVKVLAAIQFCSLENRNFEVQSAGTCGSGSSRRHFLSRKAYGVPSAFGV